MLPVVFQGTPDYLTLYQLSVMLGIAYRNDSGLWGRWNHTYPGRLGRVAQAGPGRPAGCPFWQHIEGGDFNVVMIDGTTLQEQQELYESYIFPPVTWGPGYMGRYPSFAKVWADFIWNAELPLFEATPRRPILFCGHSMGGALALMLAWRYWEILGAREVAVVSMGSPKIVSNPDGDFINGVPHIRLIAKLDPVGDLPPVGTLYHPQLQTSFNLDFQHQTRALYHWNRTDRFFHTWGTVDDGMYAVERGYRDSPGGPWTLMANHPLWQYIAQLRRCVHGAGVNHLNNLDYFATRYFNDVSATWPDYVDLTEGFESTPTWLDGDIQASVTGGDWDPNPPIPDPELLPQPSIVVPAYPAPPLPSLQMEIARRRRRNI